MLSFSCLNLACCTRSSLRSANSSPISRQLLLACELQSRARRGWVDRGWQWHGFELSSCNKQHRERASERARKGGSWRSRRRPRLRMRPRRRFSGSWTDGGSCPCAPAHCVVIEHMAKGRLSVPPSLRGRASAGYHRAFGPSGILILLLI